MIEASTELLDGGFHVGTQLPALLRYSQEVKATQVTLGPALVEIERAPVLSARNARALFQQFACCAGICIELGFPALRGRIDLVLASGQHCGNRLTFTS